MWVLTTKNHKTTTAQHGRVVETRPSRRSFSTQAILRVCPEFVWTTCFLTPCPSVAKRCEMMLRSWTRALFLRSRQKEVHSILVTGIELPFFFTMFGMLVCSGSRYRALLQWKYLGSRMTLIMGKSYHWKCTSYLLSLIYSYLLLCFLNY